MVDVALFGVGADDDRRDPQPVAVLVDGGRHHVVVEPWPLAETAGEFWDSGLVTDMTCGSLLSAATESSTWALRAASALDPAASTTVPE